MVKLKITIIRGSLVLRISENRDRYYFMGFIHVNRKNVKNQINE